MKQSVMRDKIAEIISAGLMQHDPCVSIADAIMAALPSMVKPLAWEGSLSNNGMGGRYVVQWYVKGQLGASLLFFRYGNPDVQEHIAVYSSFEDMVTAANAHHRAAIMEAFGVTE